MAPDDPAEKLGPLKATRKSGAERFHDAGNHLDFSLRDFWCWSSSDLVSNALRGKVAEFLVARALGIDDGVRQEWDAYDLLSPQGLRVEVKSAAYLQTWAQRRVSSIQFDIRPTLGWDAETNVFAPETDRRRQADVYVFALLAHREKATVDPTDVAQWKFFVLKTATLDQRVKARKTLALSALLKLRPAQCDFSQLASAISACGGRPAL